MLIGVPKEIKDHEYRVGVTPAGAHVLVQHGHDVLVETQAGARVGIPDAEYQAAGARIVPAPREAWDAELVVKVKELQEPEYGLCRRGQILFAYLHLAPEPELMGALIAAGAIGIAYETVTDTRGTLPLLAPMSRIAGKLSIQFGAWALQMANGGSGVLLGGVPGVSPARVVVIGAGAAGQNAVRVAVGMGADVTVLDVNTAALAHLEEVHGGRVRTCYSDPLSLADHVAGADLVIGATLTPGKLAPALDHARDVAADATRFGVRGHLHRPGRDRRDLAPDLAFRSDLRRGRRHPPLCAEHARGRRAYRDPGTDPGHHSLCAEACEPGLEGGAD